MRTITDHIVEGDSANQLTIAVTDQPGQGGANHRYEVDGFDATHNASNPPDLDDEGDEKQTTGPCRLTVLFQNGPIKEFGVNGITQEVLLAIVIDRLRRFQAGPFACAANASALADCCSALTWLQERMRDRLARGVEGKTQK
jgi:hypothetical protein